MGSEFRVERVEATMLHELRRRVLRDNDPAKNVVDPRDDESTSLHFGGFVDDRLVVSASFYPSTSPVLDDHVAYQLRYMATDFGVQGKGYGATVLEVAMKELSELKVHEVWANARDSALGFYVATGWTVLEGSQHISTETQLPHTAILRMLVGAE